MTAPLAHGFPDWQRNRPSTNVLYLNTSVVTTGNADYGPFFVGYSPCVGIDLFDTTGDLQVLLGWYGNDAVNITTGQRVIVCTAGGGFHGSVKNLGPWLSVSVLPKGATAQYSMALFATEKAGMWDRLGKDNELIVVTAFNLGAGANTTWTATRTWSGPVTIDLGQVGGTWNADVGVLDSTGTLVRMGHHDSTWGQKYQAQLHAPLSPMQIVMRNTDAAAHNHWAYIVGHSHDAWE